MTSQPTRLHPTKELDAHFQREPPALLHHYTGQAGLLGIVGKGEIWATSINNLNDFTEFIFAKNLAISLIEERIAAETNSVTKKHLGHLLTGAHEAGINICVASWSAVCDDLSQWRAYSHGGTGYTIDMEGAHLFALAAKRDFLFAECVYNAEDQTRIMDSLINKALAGVMALSAYSDTAGRPLLPHLQDSNMAGGDFLWLLHRYAAVFKHPKFEAEKEWRLISPPMSVGNMEFRAGRSTLISFHPFSLRDGDQPVAVKSVHVGPCPDPDLAASKVRFLLAKHCAGGDDGRSVHKSSVPHRTW
jgi:hypothetical protein